MPRNNKPFHFDYDRFFRHLRRKYMLEYKSQNQFCKEVGVTRSTMWRLSTGKTIQMETFLSLLSWLNGDVEDYIINR